MCEIVRLHAAYRSRKMYGERKKVKVVIEPTAFIATLNWKISVCGESPTHGLERETVEGQPSAATLQVNLLRRMYSSDVRKCGYKLY